jgi:hypothetical protein
MCFDQLSIVSEHAGGQSLDGRVESLASPRQFSFIDQEVNPLLLQVDPDGVAIVD